MDAKGPLAIFALLGFVVLYGVLLILPLVRPTPNDTGYQLAQAGMVSFWLAAGVSPLLLRLIIAASLLTWLASSSSGEYLGRDVFALLIFLTACITSGVGLVASFIFARDEKRQFQLRDLLVTISLYALALAIIQSITQGSRVAAWLSHPLGQLILLQVSFHGVLIGLCCVPLLARRGARLRSFGIVIPLLAAIMAMDLAISHTFFQDQLRLGSFTSAIWFFFQLILKFKVAVFLLIWITLFPADYALNLFHRPPEKSAPGA